MSPYEETLASARVVLGDLGFSVAEELDLDPWLASRPGSRSGSGSREVHGVRWVLDDGAGRRGYVAITSDRPAPADSAAALEAAIGVGGFDWRPYLGEASGGESVEGCSLYEDLLTTTLPVVPGARRPALADGLRAGLERGLAARPFASNAEVERVLSHPDRDPTRDHLEAVRGSLRAVLGVRAVLERPYAADPDALASASALLEALASGAPLEWSLRRVERLRP